MRLIAILFSGLILSGCADPIINIPGGKLSGEVTPAPATWAGLPDVVQLEMRPTDPYSINIWAVVSNNAVYVATQDARWLPFIRSDASVRLRIDKQIYELNATEVTDREEKTAVGKVYTEKYDYDLNAEDLAKASVFRLNGPGTAADVDTAPVKTGDSPTPEGETGDSP